LLSAHSQEKVLLHGSQKHPITHYKLHGRMIYSMRFATKGRAESHECASLRVFNPGVGKMSLQNRSGHSDFSERPPSVTPAPLRFLFNENVQCKGFRAKEQCRYSGKRLSGGSGRHRIRRDSSEGPTSRSRRKCLHKGKRSRDKDSRKSRADSQRRSAAGRGIHARRYSLPG
jgi:hypothetical protein